MKIVCIKDPGKPLHANAIFILQHPALHYHTKACEYFGHKNFDDQVRLLRNSSEGNFPVACWIFSYVM